MDFSGPCPRSRTVRTQSQSRSVRTQHIRGGVARRSVFRRGSDAPSMSPDGKAPFRRRRVPKSADLVYTPQPSSVVVRAQKGGDWLNGEVILLGYNDATCVTLAKAKPWRQAALLLVHRSFGSSCSASLWSGRAPTLWTPHSQVNRVVRRAVLGVTYRNFERR